MEAEVNSEMAYCSMIYVPLSFSLSLPLWMDGHESAFKLSDWSNVLLKNINNKQYFNIGSF